MNRTRRHVLTAGSGAGLLALLSAAVVPAVAAEWNKAAFKGKRVQEALNALGAASPADSTDIVMKVADIVENGAVVPIGIESRIQGTESIALLIEKNPSPLAASFDIPEDTQPSVRTRVKMAETSLVYALVKANGRHFVARKEVQIIQGGCGADIPQAESSGRSKGVPRPMRIRAAFNGDVVNVKVLMSHEMETGLRKDPAGKLVPAHFIQRIAVTRPHKTVLSAQWGTSVSRDPYLEFNFKGGQKGEKIRISWIDNQGDKRTDETTIN